MPREMQEIYISLLRTLQPYFLPEADSITNVNLGAARHDVTKLTDMFGVLA